MRVASFRRGGVFDGDLIISKHHFPIRLDSGCDLEGVMSKATAEEIRGLPLVTEYPCSVAVCLGAGTQEAVISSYVEITTPSLQAADLSLNRRVTLEKIRIYIIDGDDNVILIGRPIMVSLGILQSNDSGDESSVNEFPFSVQDYGIAYVGKTGWKAMDGRPAYFVPDLEWNMASTAVLEGPDGSSETIYFPERVRRALGLDASVAARIREDDVRVVDKGNLVKMTTKFALIPHKKPFFLVGRPWM